MVDQRVDHGNTSKPCEHSQVLRNEEDGSDVSLATWLMLDAFDKVLDAAVLITDGSDVAASYGKPFTTSGMGLLPW